MVRKAKFTKRRVKGNKHLGVITVAGGGIRRVRGEGKTTEKGANPYSDGGGQPLKMGGSSCSWGLRSKK